MKTIGSFVSNLWGNVAVQQATYLHAGGPTAIALMLDNGELLAILSVNMYVPECSHDSRDLPADCFYVKEWSENAAIAKEAFDSGLFILCSDLPRAHSGFVTAAVWQVKPWAR